MAVKEWTTSYPTAQDPTPPSGVGVQETLVNESAPGAADGDDTRVSQIHTLRDKLDAVCKIAGDDSSLPITSLKATTLKNTANDWTALSPKGTPIAADLLLIEDSADGDAKKKVQVGNLPGGGAAGETTIDTPPSSPSAYDDEFSGSSLDPKWAWTGLGAPAGAGEVWGVKYGKFYARVNGNLTGAGNHPGFAIQQNAPSLAGDWFAVAKIMGQPFANYHRQGIFVNGGSTANWVHTYLGFDSGRCMYFDYVIAGVGTWRAGLHRFDSLTTQTPSTIYLAIKHEVATHLLRFYWSWDGCAWVELSATFDYNLWGANVPSHTGIFIWPACSSVANISLISCDWFRVYAALP
jgi:hypothetical protein